MHSRAARFILLILFLISIGTATYLFWKSESTAATLTTQAVTFERAIRSAERLLLDIRAAQRGYLAAGQAGDFWAARVAQGVEAVRAALIPLRAEATTAQAKTSVDEILSTLDDFVRIDKRAVEYARKDQRLLASDVIFADGVELTDAALTSLENGRVSESMARAKAVETVRRRGVFAIIAGVASAVLTVLLLLPRAPAQRAAPAIVERTIPRAVDARPSMAAEDPTLARSSAPADAPAEAISSPSAPELPAVEPAAAVEPVSTAPIQTETDFRSVASLCVDLARVVDTRALPALLERAASVLDASGIILWIADPDGRELNPIFAQGYPQQLVNRLGTIPRDAENATAAAFRTSLLQTVMADSISAGAIAAPLVTSGGCVGVMAAEVRHDAERQHMKLAAATIVAAQLATLVGPPTARNHTKAGAAGA
jgi:CHASE3 domain sensor protein